MMDLEPFNQYWTLILLVALWELAWKGMALWVAARSGDKTWYVVMLIVNTAGILPIVYLLMNKGKAAKVDS